jgi:hypothetical protein
MASFMQPVATLLEMDNPIEPPNVAQADAALLGF